MLKVIQPFIGNGYDYPAPGTLIDPPEPQRTRLLAAGVVVEYETKVLPAPAEFKKKEPSESLPAAPVVTPETRKPSRKKSKR